VKLELAREHHRVSSKASVLKDNVVEILVGFYINSIEEKAELEEYMKLLEKINRKIAKNIRGEIETEKFKVSLMPQPCQGDHCVAGLRAVIKLNKGLNKIEYWDLDNVASLIKDAWLL
jgi:hypothetical protein